MRTLDVLRHPGAPKGVQERPGSFPRASWEGPEASQECPKMGGSPHCTPTLFTNHKNENKQHTKNNFKNMVCNFATLFQRNAYRRRRSPKGAKTRSPEVQKMLPRRPPELAVPATGSQIMFFATFFKISEKKRYTRSARIEGANQGRPGVRENGPDYVQVRKTEKNYFF